MTLRLRYYGDPCLRKHCTEVKTITPELQKLAREMIDKLQPWNGAGLAAPQVGINQRFFVLSFADQVNDQWVNYPPRVYINPKVLNPSQRRWVFEEGCLSIPELYVLVERPYSIDIEATDLNGNLIQEHLEGYPARQFMHENDHLNGVLTIDRTDPQTRKNVDPFLRKLKKKYF